jgi:hypothetical protein
MARRTITLEEKIEKAQADVAAAKEKYDKAVDVLEQLLTKRKERDSKLLIEAFAQSKKNLADVLTFLQGDSDQDD